MRPCEIIETRRGRLGVAHRIFAMPSRADESATIACWFCELVGIHPVWTRFMLSVVHLRPIANTQPPNLRFEAATHELMVVSLNPETGPVATDLASWTYLTPFNIVHQFTVHADSAAEQLSGLLVQAMLEGQLEPDPDIVVVDGRGSNMLGGTSVLRREDVVRAWVAAVDETAAHMRGEHA